MATNTLETSRSFFPYLSSDIWRKGPDSDPPRHEWIVEDKSFTVFGHKWIFDPEQPGAKQVHPKIDAPGNHKEFDRNRRASMRAHLNTLLGTWFAMLSQLRTGPPGLSQGETGPSETERAIEHLRSSAAHMHKELSGLRPFQAIETLALLLRNQTQIRSEMSEEIEKYCDSLAELLKDLRYHLAIFHGGILATIQQSGGFDTSKSQERVHLFNALDSLE